MALENNSSLYGSVTKIHETSVEISRFQSREGGGRVQKSKGIPKNR